MGNKNDKPFPRAPIRANYKPSTSYYKWRNYFNAVRDTDPKRFPKRAVYFTNKIDGRIHVSIYFMWWMLNDFT